MPKDGTKEYRKVQGMLKDAASSSKMEWLYVNRITLFIVVGICSVFFFIYLHNISVDWVYTEPTTDYDIIRWTVG